MFARMILPRLGGTPSTWNTCLLFFQTTLLVGYLYVHGATTRLTHQRHLILHVVLIAAALWTLPIDAPSSTPESTEPVIWLLTTLTASIALPFFALSTTAPLLQRWYTLRTHADPYFLYAASNVGSLVGLLSYPVLIEPTLTLAQQRIVWSVAFAVVAALVGACALLTLAPRASSRIVEAASPEQHEIETWTERLTWLALAFVPSSLLLGVTTYISTDVAAVPLLWVVPLAIYLSTYVAAFGTRSTKLRLWTARVAPILVVIAVGRLVLGGAWWSAFGIHLATFTVTALMCHVELAARRPGPAGLTRFYLWLSIGGALGGLFNALIAPAIFTQIVEYPLLLVAAVLVRPSPGWRGGRLEPLVPLVAMPVLLSIATGVISALGLMPGVAPAAAIVSIGLCLSALLAFVNRSAPMATTLGIVVLAHFGLSHQQATQVVFAERSFFGVHRVVQEGAARVNRLYHGTTVHGWQFLDARDICEPTSYYHPTGPVGQLFTMRGEQAKAVAVIGLGAGGLACYGRDDTAFTFFEIDPVVERIARDPSLFTFLANARGKMDVVLGDGRLTLSQTAPAAFDVIVVDAFSSDAIPVHLLTREFFAMALERLKSDGIMAFHISNRHLDLAPIIGAAAQALGTTALERFHQPERPGLSPSRWAAIGKTPAALSFLASTAQWSIVRAAPDDWTDDFSNIFDVLRWRRASASVAH